MKLTLFSQKTTNDINYKNLNKGKNEDDYDKTYTKKKFIFGICYYSHHFHEKLNTPESPKQSSAGFKLNS